jgi:hypothetical protein
MNELQDGIWLRSNPETWSAGGGVNFKLDFLGAARHMKAPEVAFIGIRFAGTVNSAAGTAAAGADAAKLLSNFKFTDAEEVVNCSGHNLRLNEMIELGPRQLDPADLAAGAADEARVFWIVVPFYLFKAERSRDTCIRLEHFLEGGQIECTWGALPTGYDGWTGTVRLFFYVFDGRTPELKSRLTIREVSMTQQETTYDVNGSLRTLVGTSKLTTTSASSWAAFTSFDSQTLRWPAAIESDALVRRYRFHSDGLNTNDPIVASTPLAVPFVTPDRFQKIGSMPDIKTVHLDLKAAPPTNAKLLIVAIKDRNAGLGALVAGYANVGDYQAAMEARAKVVSAKGNHKPAVQVLPELVRRLPARIGEGVL